MLLCHFILKIQKTGACLTERLEDWNHGCSIFLARIMFSKSLPGILLTAFCSGKNLTKTPARQRTERKIPTCLLRKDAGWTVCEISIDLIYIFLLRVSVILRASIDSMFLLLRVWLIWLLSCSLRTKDKVSPFGWWILWYSRFFVLRAQLRPTWFSLSSSEWPSKWTLNVAFLDRWRRVEFRLVLAQPAPPLIPPLFQPVHFVQKKKKMCGGILGWKETPTSKAGGRFNTGLLANGQ